MTYEIDISNSQSSLKFDCQALQAAVIQGLKLEGVTSAVLSISIVDNKAIHVINRDHLRHDYPTDVISFQLDFCSDGDAFDDFPVDDSMLSDDDLGEFDALDSAEDEIETVSTGGDESDDAPELRADGASIEGEIIASAEMALSMATEGCWSAQDELTLYVIHGMLHICGYEDLTPEEQSIMRSREKAIMSSIGCTAIDTAEPGSK